MIRRLLIALLCCLPGWAGAQINTDRVMAIARNALFYEDYVLSIQYFNQVISAKPYLYEPYFYRGIAKINLEDFQGAEADCTKAIDRNPFIPGCYQVRGYARIRMENVDGAIEDYTQALKFDPENTALWNNLALCRMEKKDYEGAIDDINRLISLAPRESNAYLMRADVAIRQKDTLHAEQDIDKAIEVDAYNSTVWTARGVLRLQQGKYKDAEEDLSKAIHLAVRNADNYINRALARYHQNNLRGAMSDYDLALETDPNNFIGHYNRGLLRAYVGDDNRAIEDFNFVIEQNPDDMMATFNRGLLLDKTGDLRGAIRDYSTVIAEYPNFMTGYHYRAAARRKIGDHRGAEEDELVLLDNQLDLYNGKKQNTNDTKEKTRKKSDKNMENYGKIVVADSDDDTPRYKNEYRGRVQDKNVHIEYRPMFVLTYYEKAGNVRRTIHYYKYIDELNHDSLFVKPLLITNDETSLTEQQADEHFKWIDEHTVESAPDEKTMAKLHFLRGLDFYLLQDFENAINDYTAAVVTDDTFMPAYFDRAIARYKHLEYRKAETADDKANIMKALPTTTSATIQVRNADYELVKADLDKVIKLAPDFAYAYYNRANLFAMLGDYHAAIADYNKVIELDPGFADAYYNRGLTYVYIGNNKQGIADLSKAGELGLFSAYNVIKRFTLRKN